MRAAAPAFIPNGPPRVSPSAGASAADELPFPRELSAAVLRVPSCDAAMAATPKTGGCAAADDSFRSEMGRTEEAEGSHSRILSKLRK